MSKKGLSFEECDRRKREAFESRGIDYDLYLKKIQEKKEIKREKRIEGQYISNHADNIQFGCCFPDILDSLCFFEEYDFYI